MIRRILQAFALASGAHSSSALAQEGLPTVTAGLQLDAARDCASWQELVSGVARRSSRIRLVASTGAPTTATPLLQTSLRRAADGSIAAELVVLQGGKRSLRRLSAPSCTEAVDALALVIAITLDPASVSAPASGTEDPSESQGTSGSNSDARSGEATPGSNGGSRRGGERGSELSNGESPADEGVANDSRAMRFHSHFGAGAALLLGPAPHLMPGVHLEFLAAWDGDTFWSPAIRVSAAHHWLSGVSATGGVADFELDAGSLDLCPLRVGSAVLALRACGNVQAGRLWAQGSRTFEAQSRSRPYAVLGGSGLFTAALSRRAEAMLALSVGRTLVEDEFVLASNVFYRVPAISVGLGLGFALRFR